MRKYEPIYLTLHGKTVEYCYRGRDCKYLSDDENFCSLWNKEFGYSCMQCRPINYHLKHLFKRLPYGWSNWWEYIKFKWFGIDIWSEL